VLLLLGWLVAAAGASACPAPQGPCPPRSPDGGAWGPDASAVFASERVALEPERVFEVLGDVQAWPAYMPDLERIEVEPLGPNRLAVRQTHRVLGRSVRTHSIAVVDSQRRRIVLALAPDAPQDVEIMTAEWRVSEDGSGGTRIELRSTVRTGLPVPGFLERRVVARSIEASARALRDEAERRDGALLAWEGASAR